MFTRINTEEIKDYGEKKFVCSRCDKPLGEALIYRQPQKEQVWQIRFSCPYCQDYSPVEDIIGDYYLVGVTKLLNEDTLEDKVITSIDDIKYNVQTGIITVMVGKKD